MAFAVARARIGIGIGSILAPGWAGRLMSGPGGSSAGTKLFARLLGARDLGLGLGVSIALDRGEGQPHVALGQPAEFVVE